MINYSLTQKFLHKICLSNNFIKQISFEFDNFFIKNQYSNILNNKHVFITGLARSGTTALLNFIYSQNIFASLTYNDMPFILAPKFSNLFKTKDFNKNFLRLHNDGIIYKNNSPEALDEVFWMTFNDEESNYYFPKYIYQILKKYKQNRYLSKNNYNFKRLKKIKSIFPNSHFLITYRDPSQHAYSLFNQHKNFIEIQNKDKFILDYMNWLGHNEFGKGYINWYESKIYGDNMNINHWLEQWYLFYLNLLETINDYDNLILISYEDLCNNPDISLNLIKKLELSFTIKKNYFKSSNKIITEKLDIGLLEKANVVYKKLQYSIKNVQNN